MKVSISLPARDVALLDEYVRAHGIKSRSAAVKRAVDLLRAADLADDYAAAWAEWNAGSDKGAWTRATEDGLTTKSSFTRDALRPALQRYEEAELEARHVAGYQKHPPSCGEFDVADEDRSWGDLG